MINEPEWDIWHNKIEQAAVQATVRLLAETIHARTSTPVTVGAANVEGARMWVGQGLDFHSPHWYDPMSSVSECARCSDAATIRRQAGLDGSPIVIGEFYAGPDTDTLQRSLTFAPRGSPARGPGRCSTTRPATKCASTWPAAKASMAVRLQRLQRLQRQRQPPRLGDAVER